MAGCGSPARRVAVNDLLAWLDRLESGLATLRRHTLIFGLAAVVVIAADFFMILAVHP